MKKTGYTRCKNFRAMKGWNPREEHTVGNKHVEYTSLKFAL